MIEGEKAAFQFLIAYEHLTETVEPAVRHFDHPTSRTLDRTAPLLLDFLSTSFDVRDIAVILVRSAGLPVYPASAHKCLLRRSVGCGRLTMIASRTVAN